jgi:glucoamylase
MEPLARWIARQQARAVAGMLMSISPVGIVKTRPGFGQTVRPRRGAIVASPVLAAYDPDPDYFFHWYRDSAVVMDALRLLFDDGSVGSDALVHLADFVRFSRSLQNLDGRALVAAPAWRVVVAAGFTQYLRSDADLATVHGEAVAADTRVNPDGTLDITRWTRPQHDGPPLRALALLRWLRDAKVQPILDDGMRGEIAALVRSDLDFTRSHWRTPSFDIWEEETGLHYYTLRMAGAALDEGAAWLDALGDARQAQALRAVVREIMVTLDGYWLPEQGHYRSRVLADGTRSAKELDIAVILAAIHADDGAAPPGAGPAHGARDPRMHATLARLEAVFDAEYQINQRRSAAMAPAMGRYAGDVYYSGGAYYFSTLGAAEFCFRAARNADAAQDWFDRGDAFLETVRAYTPPSGDLSEQFDRTTGVQTSARHLAWSYAAFVSCAAARRAAYDPTGGGMIRTGA